MLHRFRPLLVAAAALLAAAPAFAYTIYLKDGSKIVTQEKYTVEDGRAILVLPSGLRTFIDADQIDVQRTEEANVRDYGQAMVLSEGQLEQMERGHQPDGPASDPTLADLIRARAATVQERPTDRPPEVASAENLPRTRTGWPDLMAMPRRPFPDVEITAELESFIRGQGVEAARVFQGTRPGRPLLEFTTNAEAAVFRALTVSANGLLQLGDRFGDRVDALEILMVTPTRDRGGQFLLRPDDAKALASRRIEPAAFYIKNVQF